jgi:hypothetical protein
MAGYLGVTDGLTLTELGSTVVGKEFLRRSEYVAATTPAAIPPQPPTATTFPGYAYGDSWTGAKVGYSASSYPPLLKTLMGLSSMSNRGVAGSRIQNVAVDVQASGNKWVPGTPGLVTVGALLNNQVEGDTTNNRDTAYESMRAIVARLSAGTIREDTDAATFTYNGAWQTFTDPMPSGGTASYVNPTLAADAVHTETVTVTVPAGVNYIQFIGLAPAAGTGATFTLHNAGGAEVARQRTDARSVLTLTQGIGEGQRAPVVMRVPGTAGGVFTLKVTTPPGYAGAVLGYVDCLITLAAKPPMVVLLKPVHVLHASYQKTALETYLRTIPDTMAAEFANVVVADPNLGFDTATMLGPDLLHPIDSGQDRMATAIRDAINTTVLRRAALLVAPGLLG